MVVVVSYYTMVPFYNVTIKDINTSSWYR